MKTTRNFLFLAALALAASAGAVCAGQLDVATALTALFHSPESVLAGAALAWGPLVRDLQGKHATAVDAMKAITAKAEAEDRGMTEEEAKAFADAQAKATSLKTRIETAQATELAEAGVQAQAPAARGEGHVVVKEGKPVAVTENVTQDPKAGFAHMGDFGKALVAAANAQKTGGTMDRRLAPLWGGPANAAAPGSYAGEGSGADGGFRVPTAFSTTIFGLSLEEGALLPMTDGMPVEGNGMSFPKDETTPWGSNGVRAFWQGEAQAGTPTKPVFGTSDLKLKKLMALVPVSQELLSDGTALAAYIPPNMARSIRWKSDEAILFGNGAGLPFGAFFSPAAGQGPVITVAKDGSQATGTLSASNLARMIARLMPGSYGKSVWMINNDTLPALFTLTLGNYPIYLPAGAGVGAIQGSPYGSLLGRPVMVSQHAPSFSSQGDVMLADFTYYQSITKAEGVSMDTSMHLYFDADAVAFRATFRVDGLPKMSTPVSPAKGSATLSPFVQLEAR